jgi:hypothetical protein
MAMKQGLAKLLFTVAAVLIANAGSAQQLTRSSSAEGSMKIVLIVDGTELRATLEDNTASRDFAAMLPLDLTLTDYNGTEKIAHLPSRLSTEEAPEGVDPDVGDITYYAPWGNLAIFYRDFGYARGLVRLGRIESGVERLTGGGPLSARIERVAEPRR